MTYEQQVKEWEKAVKEAAKDVLSSRAKTRKFLEGIGMNDMKKKKKIRR